ncbi:MAG TPA: hypothetical protein VJB16_05840 [archaeon]|nr:hypothetical protein [archaeon]
MLEQANENLIAADRQFDYITPRLERAFRQLRSDVSQLESDVAELKSEVSRLKKVFPGPYPGP